MTLKKRFLIAALVVSTVPLLGYSEAIYEEEAAESVAPACANTDCLGSSLCEYLPNNKCSLSGTSCTVSRC